MSLGHEADLVGRSAECDFPPSIRDRAIVMAPRVRDFDRPSGEIDARVREARGRGESLYVLNLDVLARLRPDLLLTQDLCGVCSVTGPEVTRACQEAGVDPAIVSLSPRTLAGVWETVLEVSRAVRDPRAGERLAGQLRRRTEPRPPVGEPPRVAIVEWLDPPIVAGLWVADMAEAAGGRSLGPPSGEPGARTTWEALAAQDPDLLILAPCSFSVDRTRREIDHAGLDEMLRPFAARKGVWIADEAYFSRPGPRLADGVDLLRSRLWSTPYTPPMPARPWIPAGA